MPKVIYPFLLVAFCNSIVGAQTIQKIDSKMCYYMDKVNHKCNRDSVDFFDAYNDSLQNYLIKVLKKYPSTLKANFPRAKKHISIASSSDRKFRIYSLNQHGSGTMQGYSSVLQYKTTNGTAVKRIYPLHGMGVDMPKDTGAPGMLYTSLYTVPTKNRQPVYLSMGRSIEDSRLMYFELKAYTIKNDKLDDSIPFFENGGKLKNHIGYEIELSNEDFKKAALPEPHFSKDMKRLYVPGVDEKHLRLTGKYLVYNFNGNRFVLDKNTH